MDRRIVVNAGILETRVAVQEGPALAEFYLERHDHPSVAGNVYKGVVTNVLPGMQAAFVDIGLGKDAFLYAGDYAPDVADDSDPDDDGEAPAGRPLGDLADPPSRGPMETQVRRGQHVLVQVSKEPLGSKGARVTSFISLPGRYLVYLPQAGRIGVSRRIGAEAERERLRDAVRAAGPPEGGWIVRTNADGRPAEAFAEDVAFLGRLWAGIEARASGAGAPALIHEEAALTFRVVRDLFSAEVREFLVDDPEIHARCLEQVEALVPALADRVRLWSGPRGVFEAHGIDKELDKALRRKVWLRSGGYIVIDHTEALVSIDVNSGKYVGKRDFEQTVLKINLEAAAEVIRQIRLRDLGGIIVIDFIDMERPEHREEVSRALGDALAGDRARTNVLAISELGLVEMTRKRVRPDLRAALSHACPACHGTGVVRSPAAVAADLFRALGSKAAEFPGRELVARVAPDLQSWLDGEGREPWQRLAARLGARPTLRSDMPAGAREPWEVFPR